MLERRQQHHLERDELCEFRFWTAIAPHLTRELPAYFAGASAPATLQSIFDASAARRGWSSLALRPADGEGAGPPPAVFSTEKLAAAGYELLWPTIGGAPPSDDAPPSADV